MVAAVEQAADTTNTWDRLPGEKALWYDRFWTYVQIGPTRTLDECYRRRLAVEPSLSGTRAPSGWGDQSRKWEWAARASAYDAAYREHVNRTLEERKTWARESRLAVIERALSLVMAAIEAAKLDELENDPERARRLLGPLRSFLHDLLVAYRLELGEPTAIEQRQGVDFTADDWAAAQAQLAEWQFMAAGVAKVVAPAVTGASGSGRSDSGDSSETDGS